jgi:V/A-type H+-transporting ATPase subunit I
MIEKMRFISITGPKDDFDRVINQYLTRYDIHLENALSELKSTYGLKPLIEINPYKEIQSKSEELVKRLDPIDISSFKRLSFDESADIVKNAYTLLSDLNEKKHALKNQRQGCNELLSQIEHFRHLDYNIHQIINLKFIKYRFGKIPTEYYTKFSKYVYENLTTVFYECERERTYVWGIYFVPANEAAETDAIFNSLHFERIKIPDAYEGTPEESYQSIMRKLSEINRELDALNLEITQRLNEHAAEILRAHDAIVVLSNNFDVRKYAACTRDRGLHDVFYIICGWISEKEGKLLLKEAEQDDLMYCFFDEGQADVQKEPPIKLRNPKIFKPFEMFVRMYGLPAYGEMDPTSFVALTYSIIFGIMFGDVGQGLCLVIGGYLLFKIKKVPLAAIIATAGIFSTIFGFMYGSVFGFEDLIPPIWLSPRENVMTILITTVGFGVLLILTTMFIFIINNIKAKNWGKVLFDINGVAGLVFYAALISSVVLVFTGHEMPGAIVLFIFLGIPLILLFFREPLTHLIEKKAHIFPANKGEFFMEAFFEMFEVLLSYLTNTISFLRVGAFALSHAGMMTVVMLLAGAESGNVNIIVLILGNLIVSILEGFVVGIQVLRLEYYEMFSRFYKGNGREFKPYKSKINKN